MQFKNTFSDLLSWTEVIFDPLPARAGHTALCLLYSHEYNERDEVMFFGGGDNEGSFFNDVRSVLVPFKTPNERANEAK